MNDDMGNFPAHSEEEKNLRINGLKERPKGIFFLAMTDKIISGCIICFDNFSTFSDWPYKYT
jgi:hypothetical protein